LLCYLAGSFGMLLRIVLWQISDGSNDIRTWGRYALLVEQYGLSGTYIRDGDFNHPPLMGLWSQAVLHLAPMLGLPYGKCFKLLGMVSELATALLLFEIWRRRGQRDRAALAFAAYGCALTGILISGFHGNTDPAYWFLVLAAVYLLEDRNAPFLAGLTLGAALNVKLIPLLMVLPLAACCRSLKAALRYSLGGLVALLPFAVVLRFSGPERAAFMQNVFAYRSLRDSWGIELFQRMLVATFEVSAPPIAATINAWGEVYRQDGSKILLTITTALAVYNLCKPRAGLDPYGMAGLCFCLFLVLASGFGVQYLGCTVPLLLARNVRDGFWVASVSGVFLLLVYCSFVRGWTPIATYHFGISPAFGALSFAAWWVLVRCGANIWHSRALTPEDRYGSAATH
jgi:hypothetical protein